MNFDRHPVAVLCVLSNQRLVLYYLLLTVLTIPYQYILYITVPCAELYYTPVPTAKTYLPLLTLVVAGALPVLPQ